MPRPAVPLIALPCSVSVLPEMVTFCPTPVVIQMPPAVAVVPKFGWFVNVLLNTALSVEAGRLPVQLVPVPQVVLVGPDQNLSVALADATVKRKQASAKKRRLALEQG